MATTLRACVRCGACACLVIVGFCFSKPAAFPAVSAPDERWSCQSAATYSMFEGYVHIIPAFPDLPDPRSLPLIPNILLRHSRKRHHGTTGRTGDRVIGHLQSRYVSIVWNTNILFVLALCFYRLRPRNRGYGLAPPPPPGKQNYFPWRPLLVLSQVARTAVGVCHPAHHPRAGGNVPAELEGVPISALAAFLVPGDRGDCGRVMIAAGWSDGRWAVAACYENCASAGYQVGVRNTWKACTPGDLVVGHTSGMGAVLHFVHQARKGRGGGGC